MHENPENGIKAACFSLEINITYNNTKTLINQRKIILFI